MSSVRVEEARRARAPGDELALFHRLLADLCRSDVPLPKAFRLLQGDLRRGRFKRTVAGMAREVEDGVPLGEAYARRRGEFPPLYCALVEAGMVSGDLPGVLEQISRHAALRAETAGRIRQALAYPVVTALFVLVFGTLAFLVAGPAMVRLTEETSGTSPLPFALISLGALAATVLAVVVLVWLRSPFGIPVLGPLRKSAARSSFASTMALLLRREVPLPTALGLAAEATDEPALRSRVEAMGAAARSGEDLAGALRAGGLLESSLLWFVEAAETSGDAAGALDDIAAIYRQRLERGIDRLTTLVTPVAQVVVGLALLFVVLGTVGPLLFDSAGIFGW